MDAVEKIRQALSDRNSTHVMFLSDMDIPTFRNTVNSLGWGYVYVHIPKQESLLFHFVHEIYAYVPELMERISYAQNTVLNACLNKENRPALEMFLHCVLRELDSIKPFAIHIDPINNIIGCEELLCIFKSINLNRRYKNLKIVAITDKNMLFNSELNMFKQEIIMDSNMLNGSAVSNDEKKVFVSYSWKEPSNHIVENNLQTAFQRNGIDYELDKNDCDYRANIPAFEERIGKGEYVVAIVSDAYVHSIQCMYEMACVFENGEVNKRLFPLYFDDVKRSDEEYYNKLVEYWRKKISDTQALSTQMGEPENILYKTDLIYLEKIQKYIGDFFVYLRSTNTRSLSELGKDDFKKLVELLGGKRIPPMLETKGVRPEMTMPIVTPAIIVNGGQVNINSGNGSMDIHNNSI